MKKYYLFLILTISLLTSCDALDSYKCKQSVEKSFPEAVSIIQPSGSNFTWIVIDKDSSVYYIRTMNVSNTEVTQRELIFKY